MSNINRLLTECENTRAAEDRIEALQEKLKELNSALQADPSDRADLDTEWVETNLAILNLRYLIQTRMDMLLKDVLLQQPAECPECARRAEMRVRDILTDECPACGRSMSQFVKALVAKRAKESNTIEET